MRPNSTASLRQEPIEIMLLITATPQAIYKALLVSQKFIRKSTAIVQTQWSQQPAKEHKVRTF